MRFLLIAFVTLALSLSANDLSDEPYNKITVGMEPLAVATLIGMESSVQVHGPQLMEVTWWQDAPTGRVIVTVVFFEGKAFSKLRTFNPAILTKAEPTEKH